MTQKAEMMRQSNLLIAMRQIAIKQSLLGCEIPVYPFNAVHIELARLKIVHGYGV